MKKITYKYLPIGTLIIEAVLPLEPEIKLTIKIIYVHSTYDNT